MILPRPLLDPSLTPVAGSRGRLFLFGPVLAPSWGQLQPNFGPTWANFGQLGRNFVQLGCKINQLSTKMASHCTILNKNGPLETPKIIVFHSEFVCFRDVSLDTILCQLKANLDQFLPNLGGTWPAFGPTSGQFGPHWGRLGPLCIQLCAT